MKQMKQEGITRLGNGRVNATGILFGSLILLLSLLSVHFSSSFNPIFLKDRKRFESDEEGLGGGLGGE